MEPPDSNGNVYRHSYGDFTQILMETSARIPTQPSVRSALGSSSSLCLEPTTFRYPQKNPQQPVQLHHACLPHHWKPQPNRTAGNKEAIYNLIIIYLFIIVWRKKNSKNDVDSLCFLMILFLGLLSSSAYMFFMYIMYYIFKAGSIVLLSAIMWTNWYWSSISE